MWINTENNITTTVKVQTGWDSCRILHLQHSVMLNKKNTPAQSQHIVWPSVLPCKLKISTAVITPALGNVWDNFCFPASLWFWVRNPCSTHRLWKNRQKDRLASWTLWFIRMAAQKTAHKFWNILLADRFYLKTQSYLYTQSRYSLLVSAKARMQLQQVANDAMLTIMTHGKLKTVGTYD